MDALWYNYDLANAKENIKCIKQLEKICRDSLEYDEWQRRCKYADAKICPICNDDYYENNSKCETHHHPKTLFDIVENILDNHLEKNDLDDQTGFNVVTEIMDKHMLGQVQYINLCQHCHKKYHNGHPDVSTKLGLIFLEREKIERNKEIKEVVESDIIIDTKEEPYISPEVSTVMIDEASIIEHLDIQNNTTVAELPSDITSSILNETAGAEPQILNIETNASFVSIDIDKL